MLPAVMRMRASAEFTTTVSRGARFGVPPLVLHLCSPDPAASDAHGDDVHVGLVVSKAVGNAVVRHRVSRRLRHQLVDRVHALPPGSRLVVRALPAAGGADSATLAAALDRGFERAAARAGAR
jgi:ribonuclease P protein component